MNASSTTAAFGRALQQPLRHLLCAALLALAPLAGASPTLVTHFSQATYDVDVRAGSDLLGYFGFSGVGVTSYASEAGVTGSGVVLEAFTGEFRTLSQTLKLHFTAHAGFTFTTVDFSHLLSYFNDRGGYSASMSWVMDNGDGSPLIGTTGTLTDHIWGHGGSWSDFTQPSSVLAVDAKSFDLDVRLFYTAAGASGGCGTVSGACTQISANQVKIFTATADAPPDPPRDPPPTGAPEPAAWALVLAGLGLATSMRRRQPWRASVQPASLR